jgi:hypothetical protein
MPGPRPNKLHDELDALLDGRPVELTDELAPLAEAAEALRVELAAYQLDPEVAERHLERVLDGPATVVRMPARPQPDGWDLRRRVVAVALAAALVLAPATMASAAALPGQAMYPFKLAIEELRIAAVQWSPSREAGERTRVAGVRLGEVESLVSLRMFNQLPDALSALERAVVAARVAVMEAANDGQPVPDVAAKLQQVTDAGGVVVQQVLLVAETADGSDLLSSSTRQAIQAAAQESQDVLPPPADPTPMGGVRPANPSTPTSTGSGSGGGSAPTTDPTPPTQQTTPPTHPTQQTTPPTPTTDAPPPTDPPPPTTTPPTTTTPPATEPTVTTGSGGGGASGAGERLGVEPEPEPEAEGEDIPATTLG